MLRHMEQSSHKYRMNQSSYPAWPPLYGITMVETQSENNNYTIPRSQTLVFPFKLGDYAAVQITAGQTNYYSNQNNTIQAWPSREINGISLIAEVNPSLARKNLSTPGYDWLLIGSGVDRDRLISIPDLNGPNISVQIDPDQIYHMCFKNLENRDNGLYVRFTYLQSR